MDFFAVNSFLYISKQHFENQSVLKKKKFILQELNRIFLNHKQLCNFYVYRLRLVGSGYKSITPKKFLYKKLFLRVGYAIRDLRYTLNNAQLRMRAKKQKIILLGFNKIKIGQLSNQIINLRNINAYSRKGYS